MTKARFSSEVFVKNGRIVRSNPVGLEAASAQQVRAIETIKPILHAWLRSRITGSSELANSEILVRGKYIETSNGLTVEFKVQSVVPVG